MNKSELCARLADETGLTLDEAIKVVETFFSTIRHALMKGDRVEIRGFCSWHIKEYQGYAGRNPNTGKIVDVKPKRLPFFKAGKELKDMLNAAPLAGQVTAAKLFCKKASRYTPGTLFFYRQKRPEGSRRASWQQLPLRVTKQGRQFRERPQARLFRERKS